VEEQKVATFVRQRVLVSHICAEVTHACTVNESMRAKEVGQVFAVYSLTYACHPTEGDVSADFKTDALL
jgi:hypothetical protein